MSKITLQMQEVEQRLKTKWQKKTYTGSITAATSGISELAFSNLTIGKTYKITLSAEILVSGNSSTEQMGIQVVNNSNIVARLESRHDQGTADNKGLMASSVGIFKATAATLTTSVDKAGTGTVVNPKVFLEELPDHEEVSVW